MGQAFLRLGIGLGERKSIETPAPVSPKKCQLVHRLALQFPEKHPDEVKQYRPASLSHQSSPHGGSG